MKADIGHRAGRGARSEHLLVVSHVVHYHDGDRWFAYGPYVRELELWAGLFDRLTIAAPVRTEAPPGDCLPVRPDNVALSAQPETGGVGVWAKTLQLLMLPRALWTLGRSMSRADAIHVRCPGNLGLLGAVIGPLFSSRLVAKYAGQWGAHPGERWTVRFQRAILRSRWWRGPVLVYGSATGLSPQIVPFFSSALDAAQMQRARQAGERQRVRGPLRLLFVGRLSREKNAGVLLEALAALRRDGVAAHATIVGDGPDRARLEVLAQELQVRAHVAFAGAIAHDLVLGHYENADVAVLLSETEGWPKAICEAMAFGLVCIGGNQGAIPMMLDQGRGLILPRGDSSILTSAIRQIAAAPERYEGMRFLAAQWAQQFTLDAQQAALAEVLERHWRLGSADALGVAHA